MKPKARLNKIQIVAAIVITLIAFLRIGYIAFGDEIAKSYYTSADYDLSDARSVPCTNVYQTFSSDQNRLNSLELVLTNIADDKQGTLLLQITSGGDIKYQTNLSLSGFNNNEWRKIFINAEIVPNQEYSIYLTANDDCSQIPDVYLVSSHWAPEIKASSAGGSSLDGQVAVNYGYLRTPFIPEKICEISLCVILWLLLMVLIRYFPNIRSLADTKFHSLTQVVKPAVLFPAVEVILAWIIVSCSGIEFQSFTKIIIFVISLISTVHIDKKIQFVQTLADVTWKKIILFFLYAYAAFALVGQRIFIYPLTVQFSLAGLFVYISALIWNISVINGLLYDLDNAVKYGFAKSKMKTWQFVILCSAILIVPALYNLFAYNPGISSNDTYTCMVEQAQHLHGSEDWHPVFYCIILRLIENVWNSTYAVIAVQYAFWLYVWMELLLYLRKKGINEAVLICVALFSGFNSANYIQINTIWKDIPYTLSVFWSLIILAKLAIDYETYKKKWYIYLELLIALTGTALFRKNGIVTYIIAAAFLIIILRKNIKVYVTVALSILMIWLVNGPVYSYLQVQPVQSGMYIGLSQDILGAYYSGGEVTEDTLKMINVMTGNNNAEFSYTPTYAEQSYDLGVPAAEFIGDYLSTFVRNPVVMLRAAIDREDAVWDIFTGQDSVLRCLNYTDTLDGKADWNDYYPHRHHVSIYDSVQAVNTYIASSQWLSSIVWRCGLFVISGLIAFVYLAFKGGMKKTGLMLTPILGHILSLILSTGWSDFRYFWPLNLMNLAVILLVMVTIRYRDNSRPEQEK